MYSRVCYRMPSYDRKRNDDKHKMNVCFAACMKKYGCRNALIQDGLSMRSTEYIHRRANVPLYQITSVEKNPKVHAKHLKGGIHSVLGELWSQVVSFPNPYDPYDALLLDTVNSLTTLVGESNVENLFRHRFVAPQRCVVLLTGTKRSNKRDEKWVENLGVLKAQMFEFAMKYGYHCELLFEQEQTKVVTVIFLLRTHEYIPVDDEFSDDDKEDENVDDDNNNNNISNHHEYEDDDDDDDETKCEYDSDYVEDEDDTRSILAEPKRRGRKPKAKAVVAVAAAVPTEPKRRGRKPKAKAVVADAVTAAVPTEPKRRGRKPKAKTVVVAAAATTTTTTRAYKGKRRGRKPTKSIAASVVGRRRSCVRRCYCNKRKCRVCNGVKQNNYF